MGPYEDLTRHVLIELCLTLPARLASLIPHMPVLLRLTVTAVGVKSRGELNAAALRTLEFWIDHLGANYLYNVLAQEPRTMTDMMHALCNNLRPSPFPFGTTALRILGKLGGKNRLFLAETMPLPAPRDDTASAHVEWDRTDYFKVCCHCF